MNLNNNLPPGVTLKMIEDSFEEETINHLPKLSQQESDEQQYARLALVSDALDHLGIPHVNFK